MRSDQTPRGDHADLSATTLHWLIERLKIVARGCDHPLEPSIVDRNRTRSVMVDPERQKDLTESCSTRAAIGAGAPTQCEPLAPPDFDDDNQVDMREHPIVELKSRRAVVDQPSRGVGGALASWSEDQNNSLCSDPRCQPEVPAP